MGSTVGTPRHLSRTQFWYMHLMKCDQCRKDWLDSYEEIPLERRAKRLEQVVYANHDKSNIA